MATIKRKVDKPPHLQHIKVPEAQGRRTNPNQELYNSTRWRKTSKAGLKAEPLCRKCAKEGRVKAGRLRDHIVPYNEGGDFWDTDNHQTLCDSCHNKKSASESHKNRIK